MKYINEYLEEVLRIKPLGSVMLSDIDIIPGCELSGQEVIIDGISTGIYVSHIDYADWLERRYDILLDKFKQNEEENSKRKDE